MTLYCFIFAMIHFNQSRDGTSMQYGTWISRIVKATRGSTYDLFTGAMLLNLAIQIGVFQEIGRTKIGMDTIAFAQASTALVLAFSFFPLMVLYPLVSVFGNRRRVLKLGLIAMLWAMWSVSAVVFGLVNFSSVMFEDPLNYGYIKLECDRKVSPGHANLITAFVCTALLIPPFCAVMTGFYFILDGLQLTWLLEGPRVQKLKAKAITLAPYLLALVGLIGMWAVLALLICVRYWAKPNGGGDDDQRPEWTTGQILAVTTWMPVVVEFLYILCCKPRPLGSSQVSKH